jgi:Fur family iron response transcriptional regulator
MVPIYNGRWPDRRRATARNPIGASGAVSGARQLSRISSQEVIDVNDHQLHLLDRLRDAGLRPTKQRQSLAQLLFAHGDRHITAERLHEEAMRAGVPVSLATVYNTLHQFTEAGLLREVVVEGAKTHFDTNVSQHHHFFNEADGSLSDVPMPGMQIAALPEPPEGMEITQVEVTVRIAPKKAGR